MNPIPNDPQLKQRQTEYREYLDQHIEKVHQAYKDFGPMLIDKINSIDLSHPIDIIKLERAVREHDLKKYEPDEFYGYRLFWFPTSLELETYSKAYRQVCLNKSFNLHSHESDHHPEFWSYLEGQQIICVPMSNEAIVEMLLDWQTKSGRAFSKPSEYWESIRYQKAMHDETRDKINVLIHELPGVEK